MYAKFDLTSHNILYAKFNLTSHHSMSTAQAYQAQTD
jgi:hypothetical protein